MQTDPPPENQAETAATPASISLTPEQLTALGLTVETATPESFATALGAALAKAAAADDLTVQLAAATEKLVAIDAEAKRRGDEELDALLGDYDLDEETTGILRGMDPAQRTPLLGKLPKKAAPAAAEAKQETGATIPPPPVVHDPGAVQTPKEKAAEGDKLIAEIRKTPGSKFTSYEAARNEARRRQPELFS